VEQPSGSRGVTAQLREQRKRQLKPLLSMHSSSLLSRGRGNAY
jgi:hypothetical protein